MSRGPGHIQRKILSILDDDRRKRPGAARHVEYLARRVYGRRVSDEVYVATTLNERNSVRRALRMLERDGAVAKTTDSVGRNRWSLINHDAIKRAQRAAPREANGIAKLREERRAYALARGLAPCPLCGNFPTPGGDTTAASGRCRAS